MNQAPPHSDSESFARYLAKLLVVKQGYTEGTVPEAQKLAGASDILLTKTDGMTFSAICIIDAERDSSRRFGLPCREVVEIAKACRARYAGRVNRAKMPATIEIIEVRKSVRAEDWQRLKPLRARVGAVVFSYAVDLSASTVTVNAWSPINVRRRFLERALRGPRLPEDRLVRPAPAALPGGKGRQPVLTYLMLAGLAGVFVVEQLAPVAPGAAILTPNVRTLVALGGLARPLVLERGEWYRLFTAALLHADPIHLALNGLALWMAGLVLEPLLGRAWLFSLFFVGALGGSLMSLAVNPADIVSVGASGAIMGLLAAALVVAFRVPPGPERTAMYVGLLRILIPSLIPLATVRTGARIDFAAHLGGALVGCLFGAVARATWPRTSARPRFAGAATALALSGGLVFAWSGSQAQAGYARYALERFLIPQDRLPKTNEEVVAKGQTLAAAYPRDPRSRLYSAVALLQANDPTGAEAELRRGLAEKEILQTFFGRDLEVGLRSVLAQTLLVQNRVEDAREAVKPICNAGPGGGAPERLRAMQLCP
jgi:rhomboid protease GluP